MGGIGKTLRSELRKFGDEIYLCKLNLVRTEITWTALNESNKIDFKISTPWYDTKLDGLFTKWIPGILQVHGDMWREDFNQAFQYSSHSIRKADLGFYLV